jgi:ABC-type uncharacterized transport system ATPase subunit
MKAMSQLRVQSLTKIYPSVVANDSIDLEIQPGEIHAVLGENGAGKSTLMKMIYGVTLPTRGEIFWEDNPIRIRNPAHARALGIGMVFQHFSLFESLTVVENTALALPGGQSLAALGQRISEVSEHYGLTVNPNRMIHDLSVGERQRVEIIRCLLQKPKLLIMDEPTSVLSPPAVDKLFETLRLISQEGCAILYISHKLVEIQSLCDRATILRSGKVSGTCIPAQETPQSLSKMMIGRDFDPPRRAPNQPGAISFSIHNLSRTSDDPFGTNLSGIDLSVHAGEILGIAGVSGNGQKELCRVMSGETPAPDHHAIKLMGKPVGKTTAFARRAQGLAYIPEDRLGQAAISAMSLTENVILTGTATLGLARKGLLDLTAAESFARRCISEFKVKAQGPDAIAGDLSGGNLQKFIAGREILQGPKVMICAQPTWGVDVGAAAFIRQALIDLARQGCAVIVISEELDELFEISNRIAVLAQGRLSPVRSIDSTSVEQIGLWMSGLWQEQTHAAA